MGEVLAEIWSRATSAGPTPELAPTLVIAAVALVLVAGPTTYRVIRHGVTVVHEAGHAVVAVLVGRRVTGIRLHADTSGMTLSRGRPRGPGMVATLLAGYPAPAVCALLAALVLAQGYAAGLLWAVVLATAVMVLAVRNLYGLWVLLVLGSAVAAASWALPPTVLTWIAHLVVWTLLLAAPRSVLELARVGRRRDGDSDAAQLARLTGVPRAVWLLVFLVLTVGAGLMGAGLLLP